MHRSRHRIPSRRRWVTHCRALLCRQGPAPAQDAYPVRPVKIVVPFTPGTGIDILARTLGQKMGDDWKVAVVIENKPGASGNIGTEAVAKSPPDGYTLLMTASHDRAEPQPVRIDPVRPDQGFRTGGTACGRAARAGVNPSVKAKTVKEFIALAKEIPGRA